MEAGVPSLSLGADLLIAEAKQRTRRRRLLAVGGVVVVVAAAAAGTKYELRSSTNARGICATAPTGWKERLVTGVWPGHPTVWLTNFRFGPMNDLIPHGNQLNWPPDGVTLAVTNLGRRYEPDLKSSALRFTRADFGGLEGETQPSGFIGVRTQGGVILHAYVEVGTLTPATIAAANKALANVRVCSA
jgi:hypothetical protein